MAQQQPSKAEGTVAPIPPWDVVGALLGKESTRVLGQWTACVQVTGQREGHWVTC